MNEGHSSVVKRKWAAAASLLFVGYLFLPFFSGLFAWTSDPYGPKIFFDTHHYLLHRAGEFVADRPFSSEPFYMWGKPTPWFYGMGEKVSLEEIRRREKEINEGAEAALRRLRERKKSVRSGEEGKNRLREDMIESGMSSEQVLSLLGKPERVEREAEARLEAWTYYEREENLTLGAQLGGLTIVFKDGMVHKVMPIGLMRHDIQ